MLEEAIEERIELVLPDLVVDETVRVLREKLGLSEERCREVVLLLTGLATDRPATDVPAEPVTGDAADDVILACAVVSGADVLVTGDRRHLLPLAEYHGVRLLTPQALLAELRTG